MAAKTAKGKTKSTKAAKPEPVEEVEEVEEEELEEEFDEVEEDEVVETPPAKAKKKSTPTTGDVTFGVKSICKLIGEKTGTEPTTRELRILIRRLARDTKNQRVVREIVAGNRTPYSWTGPEDLEVKAIVKAWMAGEQLLEKADKLAALKERGEAAKTAKVTTAKKASAAGPAPKSTKTKKAAKPVVVEEDDEDLDFDEDDED